MTPPAALLLAALAANQEAARPELLLLRFRAASVDGVDELVLQASEARVEHREWDPIRGLELELLAPLPRDPALRFAVRAKSGRARVNVTGLPAEANQHTLRVLVDDGAEPGAAPLAFELWAVPVRPTPQPFDVVVITIDSLRPDHLGCYGYARPTSPNLDAFAASGVRYTNAFSPSSFTPPSHASLLTSRQVGDHGLLTWNALADAELTLPEILAQHGYRTGASVNLTLLSENNLGQGVEWRREGERDARAIVDDALRFLREPDARPCFLWLHLYDVHRPYGRARGWSERFSRAPRPGLGDAEPHYNLRPADLEARGLARAELEHLVDRYDAGIAYADAELGPLLAELSSPARLARTLVVVTADHGESLLDHDERWFTHDPFLYAAVARVPLLVRWPGRAGAGEVRSDLTGLIDVAPSVLALLGIPAPPSFAGRALGELARGARWPERELYQECWGWERLAGVRTKDWFVLRDLARARTSVFALSDDPGELHALAAPADPAARALAEKLERFAARRPADETPPAIDPGLQRRLRALGYVDDK